MALVVSAWSYVVPHGARYDSDTNGWSLFLDKVWDPVVHFVMYSFDILYKKKMEVGLQDLLRRAFFGLTISRKGGVVEGVTLVRLQWSLLGSFSPGIGPPKVKFFFNLNWGPSPKMVDQVMSFQFLTGGGGGSIVTKCDAE